MDVRAQVSVEYLAVSLVALALLSISLSSLISIRELLGDALEASRFRSSADGLAKAMAEVCALGDGNGREISLGSSIEITSSGGLVSMKHGNHSMVRAISCETEQAGLGGIIYVENEEGKVRFRER